MTDVQITCPATDGRGNSIIIDGVEMRDALSSFTVTADGPHWPTVTLSVASCEAVRLGMEAGVAITPEDAETLKSLGWTPPPPADAS